MRCYRRRIAIAFSLAVFLLLAAPAVGLAQDYSFTVDETVVDVWINPDGSVSLEYWLTFTCDYGAHAIDVVDLGLPTGDYSLTSVSATSKGRQIAYVEESDWLYYGVAIWLGEGTIYAGETGTVHIFVDRVGGMIYEDSEDPEYGSTEFIPNYFEGGFVQGTTEMTVRMHLPAGVQPEEPRYHRSPSGWPQTEPDSYHDADGRIVYEWYHATADAGREYTFGASYPSTYVEESAIQEPPSTWELILGAIEDASSCMAGSCPLVCVGGAFAGIVGLSIYGQSRRKMKYLPPSMKVEGVGIKRGLTAVEAAILLETPLNSVLTMTLFGLLKKGAVTVLDDDPLRVEPNDPLPEGLRAYEQGFLKATKKDKTLSEPKLRTMMVDLVNSVNKKMKGFSRKETSAYYQDIVRRAWGQVEGAKTPELKSEYFDQGLEWAMLDEDFDDRIGRSFGTGPVFLPPWYTYYRPWVPSRTTGASAARGPSPAKPSAGRVQLPSLPGSAFAANFVRGVQSTASNIVRSVTGFTGGVTNVTNPPPKPSSSSRSFGSSGGSSCACACACACAGCACACAGGGR